MNKKCYTCKLYKNKSEFNKNKSRKDGLNSICKICSAARSKQYYNDNKEHHIKVVNARKKSSIDKSRKFIIDYLQDHPCVDCGETDIIVLQFDHGKDKSIGISRAVSNGWSIESIKKEIDKCEVRCANCHIRKTSKQLNWYKSLII